MMDLNMKLLLHSVPTWGCLIHILWWKLISTATLTESIQFPGVPAMAFVMECYENGILNKERTGGYELNFGNGEEAMEMLHQMARGEGFGKIIGLGIHRMKRIFCKRIWW